jgi:hypothetical protein
MHRTNTTLQQFEHFSEGPSFIDSHAIEVDCPFGCAISGITVHLIVDEIRKYYLPVSIVGGKQGLSLRFIDYK